MRRIISEAIAILMVFSVMFSGMPYLAGSLDAHAASASKKITLKATVIGQTEVTLKWSKIKKPGNGYAVFRDGKVIRKLGKKKTSFTDKGLEPGTAHKYQIKTYTRKKVTKWYNKKTCKWQIKKPAKKYTGKSRKVTEYTYRKKSNAVTVQTAQPEDSTSDTETKELSVIWKNWDGSVLYSCTARSGETPEYKGVTPSRPDEADFRYTFKGWDSVPSEESCVNTYEAVYEKELAPSEYSYSIRFLNEPSYSRIQAAGKTVIYIDTDNPHGDDIVSSASDGNRYISLALFDSEGNQERRGGTSSLFHSVKRSDPTYVDLGTLTDGYIAIIDLQWTGKTTVKVYEEKCIDNEWFSAEVASR